MIQRRELEDYLHQYLHVDTFQDYAPNGLQVEGKPQIYRICTAVTASLEIIQAACAYQADALLVHHGYFWKGEDLAIRALKKTRIKSLLLNDISLFAYHLPLDAHPQFGNNVQLAKLLDLTVIAPLEKHGKHDLGLVCELKEIQSIESFSQFASNKLSRESVVLGPANKNIKKVALCTGAAQSMFEGAILNHKIDAYLTGEVSEPSFHLANEYACNFISLGHHASERYGVKALAEHLQTEFKLETVFVDLTNPI
jgi:dinuclear metal center YbgI/SA1388 family protein